MCRMTIIIRLMLSVLCLLYCQAILIFDSSIHHVHNDAFYGLVNLRTLRIKSPLLHTLPSLEFVKHSIVSVTFVACPIRPTKKYFSCCPRLQKIHMINNRLEAASWDFHNLSITIKHIDLSHNGISSLKPLEEISFPNLTTLSLHDNRITFIWGELLLFPLLKRLQISQNLITNMGNPVTFNWGEALPPGELVMVYLRWNPWHCNGTMDWLTDGIYDQNTDGQIIFYRPCPSRIVINILHAMVCNSPPEVAGRRVVPVEIARNVSLQGSPFRGKPDSKVHGANMGSIWGRQDPCGPHVGPMNLAIWEVAQIIIKYADTLRAWTDKLKRFDMASTDLHMIGQKRL